MIIFQNHKSGIIGHGCSLLFRIKVDPELGTWVYQNPSQEPPASSKSPNEDLKDMDVLCTLKINKESQNLEHGFIKGMRPYTNQDQDSKPQSRTSNSLQSP